MTHIQYQKIPKRVFQFVVKPVRPWFDNHVGVMRSGPARGMKRKGGFAFIPAPPTPEEKFLNTLHWTGKTVYDLGANIGVMSLFFSKAVGPTGTVHAFEPNPDTIPVLQDNLRVNRVKNVAIHNVAVGDIREDNKLVVHKGRRGSGSLAAAKVRQFEELGDNRYYEIQVFPLDEYIESMSLQPPHFVKIDVEGLEYPCLRGAEKLIRRYRPALHIEMHGPTEAAKLANAKRCSIFLHQNGYQIFHVQHESTLDIRDFKLAARGHIYCQVL